MIVLLRKGGLNVFENGVGPMTGKNLKMMYRNRFIRFINPFDKYSLSTNSVSGPVLFAGATA